MQHIYLPFTKKKIKKIRVGDELLLSGVIYTARDQAHKQLVELLKRGKKLPIDLKNSVIYYCGPNPKRGKLAIGSCGPTTSSRMDKFSIPLFKAGLKVTIGKGKRSEEIRKYIKKIGGVYLLAPAGCGALLAQKVKKARLIAFGDLKSEAIYELTVHDFPVVVGIDPKGRDIYDKRK
ncbi:MAG: FumA C-terminus/TtdB family hydratase beta subunit [Candidatus Omnitrophota bacterium]